jgi:hypothetical protein
MSATATMRSVSAENAKNVGGTQLVHEFEEVEDLPVDVLADDGLLLEVRHPGHLRIQLARVL